MLEMDKRKMHEESSGIVSAAETQTSFLTAMRKRLSGAGEEVKLHGRPPFLLIVLLIASLAWFLSDSKEPESAQLAPPSAHAPETAYYEETMGMEEAQENVKLEDPFCLLHSEEQATLAAIVAVGGDSVGNDMVNRMTGKKADADRTATESSRVYEADEKVRETAKDKTVERTVAVPMVRGTVASGGGTVVLLSIGERDFFLAEGEEKNGVLLQSLSEKSAVVVVDGKSYTLSLPG